MFRRHWLFLLKLLLAIEALLVCWAAVFVPSWSWPTGKFFIASANQRPVAHAGADTNVNELDGSVLLNGGASYDPDVNQQLTYTWTELVDQSDGCSLQSFSGQTPTVALENTLSDYVCSFRLEVNDGQADSLADEVNVVVSAQDQAPTFTSSSQLTFDEGQAGQVSILLADPENGEIDFTVEDSAGDFLNLGESLDSLMTIQSSRRVDFSWTPSFEQAGEYEFSLTASDGGNSITQEIVVTVTEVDRAPVLIQSLPDIQVSVGSNTPDINLADYFSDPDGDALTFTVVEDSDLSISLQDDELVITVPTSYQGPSQMFFIAAEAAGEIAVSNTVLVQLESVPAATLPKYVTGTTRGTGQVTVADKQHTTLSQWTAFEKGGVLPKLLFVSDQAYVLTTKYQNRQQFKVFSSSGEFLDGLRLSSLVSWEYSLPVETDHHPLTGELLLMGKRGTTIFLKVLKFDSSTQKITVSKSTKVGGITDDQVSVTTQGSSVMLTGDSDQVLFLWNL